MEEKMVQIIQIIMSLVAEATKQLLLPVAGITILIVIINGIKYMISDPDEKKIWLKQIKLTAAVGVGLYCSSAFISWLLSSFEKLV